MTARTGAMLTENMSRLGHSTATASLLYQAVVAGRDEEIADALSALAGGKAERAVGMIDLVCTDKGQHPVARHRADGGPQPLASREGSTARWHVVLARRVDLPPAQEAPFSWQPVVALEPKYPTDLHRDLTQSCRGVGVPVPNLHAPSRAGRVTGSMRCATGAVAMGKTELDLSLLE